MTSSSQQFEEWFWKFARTEGNDSLSLHDVMHEAWQASRQCIEVGLPEVEDPANFFCEVYDTHKIQQAMTSAGIKIKGA